jgi:hypothetical protein
MQNVDPQGTDDQTGGGKQHRTTQPGARHTTGYGAIYQDHRREIAMFSYMRSPRSCDGPALCRKHDPTRAPPGLYEAAAFEPDDRG